MTRSEKIRRSLASRPLYLKLRQQERMRAYRATPEGKEASRRACDAMISKVGLGLAGEDKRRYERWRWSYGAKIAREMAGLPPRRTKQS